LDRDFAVFFIYSSSSGIGGGGGGGGGHQYYSIHSPLAVLSHRLFTSRAAKALIMARPVAENVGSA
jgi:hypothetical protein